MQLTAVEVQRTRVVAAQTLTEVNLARVEYNSAVTRAERAAATIRLAQAEIAHNIAIHQSTVAVSANAVAQEKLNAARSRGALLLGALGGWTGVATIGVMALTAAYMAFMGGVEETTPVLDKQGKSVKDLTEEYEKLDEAKQRQAKRVAQEKLNVEQQKAYDKVKTQLERENYIQVNMGKRGIGRAQAEYEADFRGESGMGFTNADGKMPDQLIRMRDAGWKLKQDAEARTKAEQETLKTQGEQTKEAEKKTNALKAQSLILQTNDERTRNMLMVYQSFRKAGLGDNKARVMTAQVGRENDFVTSKMYGSHQDKNNNYTNTGFLSWQKTRSKELIKHMGKNGLLVGGKITQGQPSLDAMARFAVSEMASDPYYAKTKNAMQQGNISYRELEKIVGKNFVGWDYVGNKLGKSTAAQHLSKQDGYYKKLSEMLGSDADGVMGVVGSAIDKQESVLQKQMAMRQSLIYSTLNESERINADLEQKLADVAAGFSDDQAKAISSRLSMMHMLYVKQRLRRLIKRILLT